MGYAILPGVRRSSNRSDYRKGARSERGIEVLTTGDRLEAVEDTEMATYQKISVSPSAFRRNDV
jgi:hypothetical protein